MLKLLLLSVLLVNSTLSTQELTQEEAELLNEHFKSERGDFEFNEKKVAFFLTTALWTKEAFFKQLKERNHSDEGMANQLIILSKEQKENSGGYDAFIFSWSKRKIQQENIEKCIEKLKEIER